MKTISFVMQKGGAGKTTLCDELAHALKDRGFKVEVSDVDDQQSSYFENTLTDGEEPDFLIFDTKGSMDTGISLGNQVISVADIVESSDLVIIPCTLESDCKDQLPKVVNLCEEKGVKYLIVMNRADFRRELDRLIFSEVTSEFSNHVAKTVIVQSAHIAKARAIHSSAAQVDKRSKGAVAISALADEILGLI